LRWLRRGVVAHGGILSEEIAGEVIRVAFTDLPVEDDRRRLAGIGHPGGPERLGGGRGDAGFHRVARP